MSPKDALRLALVAAFRSALAARSRAYVLAPGPALVVSPHADDETLGCGGLIASKVRAGQAARVVFLTDSSASHPGHPRLDRAAIRALRRAEALEALSILGLGPGSVDFLDAPDGELERLGEDGRRSIRTRLRLIAEALRPSEIAVPWRPDGSSEHAAAHDLAAEAFPEARLLAYPIWAWWNPPRRLGARLLRRGGNWALPLAPELRALKRRALRSHRSQLEPLAPWPRPALPAALVHGCCGPREFYFSGDPARKNRLA